MNIPGMRWFLIQVLLCAATTVAYPGRHKGRSQKSVPANHWRERLILNTSRLAKAWRQECRREMSCYEHPAVPRKAYLITMPTAEDKAKREYSIRQLEALGLEIEVVDGINTTHYAGPEDQYTRCLPAGDAMDCQLGLTLTHVEIWRRIVSNKEASAWVFEDDMVLHDDIVMLFPQYWKEVPKAFEYIAVGQIPRAFGVSNKLVTAGPEKTPWGTHAYIISAHLAERMALLAKLMVERSKMPVPSVTVQGEPYWFHTTSWVLDGEDMKIDHFLSLVYDSLTPRSDKSRWVIFESTADVPFVFKGVEWSRHGGCECGCASLDMVAECTSNGRAPAYGTGLAAQHRCARNVQFLEQWTQSIKDAVANGSVLVCKERKACGAYLCDGERPIEADGKAQISPVSAFINAELKRDPEFLSKSIAGNKKNHEAPGGVDQVSGGEVPGETPAIQSESLPGTNGAVEEHFDKEPAGVNTSAAIQPFSQEEPRSALPKTSAEPSALPAGAGDVLRQQPASEEVLLSQPAETQQSTVKPRAEKTAVPQAAAEDESHAPQSADAGEDRGKEMPDADAARSLPKVEKAYTEEQPASPRHASADESAEESGDGLPFGNSDAFESDSDMDTLMSPMESEADTPGTGTSS